MGRLRWVLTALTGLGLACDAPALGPAPAPAEVELPRQASADSVPEVVEPDDDGFHSVELVPRVSVGASSSSLALAQWGDRELAVLADADEQRVVLVDSSDGSEVADFAVPGVPAHVIVGRQGTILVSVRDADLVLTLALQCGGAQASQEACTPRLVEAARVGTAAEPVALALTDGGATLLVTCIWGRSLEMLPLTADGRRESIALSREPRGVVLEGERAWVAHAVGSRISIVSLAEAVVEQERALHWRDMASPGGFAVGNTPRFAVQGHAVAMLDDEVVVPMVLAYPGEPQSEADGYGVSIDGLEPFFPHEPVLVALAREGGGATMRVRNRLMRVDQTRRSAGRRKAKSGQRPCLVPKAIAVDPSRSQFLVACKTLGEVIAYTTTPGTLGETEVRRWRVGADADAVAVHADGEYALTWSVFDRELRRLPLGGHGSQASTVALLASTRPVIAAAGRREFHAPRALDGRSCASCHVDGRDDGLVWNSPRGRVQTPMLAGRTASMGPFGWHGEKADMESHIRRTFDRLEARKPSDETVAALALYIGTMPTFRPGERALTAQQRQGQALFQSTALACDDCHVDGGGTDGFSHQLGRRRAFDTPSLRFVGETGPYMHDGRYETLRAVVTHTDGTMGTTAHLSDTEVDALIAYLRVL